MLTVSKMHAIERRFSHVPNLIVFIKPLLDFPEFMLQPLEVGNGPNVPKFHISAHRPYMLIINITVCSKGVHFRLVYNDSRVGRGRGHIFSRALVNDGDMCLVKLGTVPEHLRVAANV